MSGRDFLPPGCNPKDVSDPDECPRCEGSGTIEQVDLDSGETREVQCRTCSGLGVRNRRNEKQE
jgi:DnaJ-class molecular chaperone